MQEQDVCGHHLQELPVVRHHEQRAGPRLQIVLQPDDGLHVQHVGRLVKQQQVRPGSGEAVKEQGQGQPGMASGDRQQFAYTLR